MRSVVAAASGFFVFFVSAAGAHEHAAPHGGALVELGEENAHLEFVLDPERGEVAAFVLDGEAESAVRIAMPALELRVLTWQPAGGALRADPSGVPLRLEAVANVLTGETRGDTSEFRGSVDALRGATAFSAVVDRVQVRGAAWTAVAIRFPEGNEEAKR